MTAVLQHYDFDRLAASLPSPHWVRVIEANHAFAGSARALLDACGDAIAWASAINVA